jgi:membrane-associated phospholipid phosphatase
VVTGERPANGWRITRLLCAAGYLGLWVVIVLRDGVPTNRETLMSLMVLGLGISTIGYGWRRFGRVLLDWLPFTSVLLLYDLSRSLATATKLPVHVRDVAAAERTLFGGHVPTLWLQHHLYTPGHAHWYDALATLVYTSHFIATPVLAAILWLRNRRLWISYISRVIALSFAGLLTYVLFPEAPPWLAARDHVLTPVYRLSAQGWLWLHAPHVESLLDAAQREGSNPVAAMPSLHTAFATLIALFLAARTASRWRYLLYAYPALMGLTLVYTGEHYVLDVVAGVAFAMAVHAVLTRWERNRQEIEEEAVLARAAAEAAGEVAAEAARAAPG